MQELILITGSMGMGKSTVTLELSKSIGPNWTILRADDFIGPTMVVFKDKGTNWTRDLRQFRPYLLGWSAGYFLSNGQNVLAEGCIKNQLELDNLKAGATQFTQDFKTKVILLEGDVK